MWHLAEGEGDGEGVEGAAPVGEGGVGFPVLKDDEGVGPRVHVPHVEAHLRGGPGGGGGGGRGTRGPARQVPGTEKVGIAWQNQTLSPPGKKGIVWQRQ